MHIRIYNYSVIYSKPKKTSKKDTISVSCYLNEDEVQDGPVYGCQELVVILYSIKKG